MSLDERPTLLAVQHGPWEGPEIGFAPVDVLDPGDALLGGLAPRTEVLHWHGDVFDLPDGAKLLASSERTPCQAFRAGNAWGVLFHPEADYALVEAWLAVPAMVDEAIAALGEEGTHDLPERAGEVEATLTERTAPGFAAFAEIVAAG